MAERWRPSGAWTRRFRLALDEAFDEASMELLTVDHFTPSTFSKISSPGLGKSFTSRLQDLINEAQMNDWLPDLVAAARERRPRNRILAEIADDLGLTSAGSRLDNPTGRPLEALINEQARFIDPSAFRHRLPELEGQVCWIESSGGGGTGFLVGPDLVLTNQHVVAGLGRPQDVRCLFDYRRPLDGSTLGKKQATRISLASGWLVASWPPSRHDVWPDLGEPAAAEIDCAIIRLAEEIGHLPIGGASADPDAEPRKWIDVTAVPAPVTVGNQVFLLQHPEGEPVQLSIGTVAGLNPSGTRLRYDANSKPGSSGSPCFDADLRLVGLHHARDPVYPPGWNQAIPLEVMQRVWREAGLWEALCL